MKTISPKNFTNLAGESKNVQQLENGCKWRKEKINRIEHRKKNISVPILKNEVWAITRVKKSLGL